MSIEQRAHEAAMSNLQSCVGLCPQESAQAYQKVYESIVEADMVASLARCGGYEKAVESAVAMARLHEQGMVSMVKMDLRMQIDILESRAKRCKEKWWIDNVSFAMVGAILGALAMWLG